MGKTELITFDADGTLFDFERVLDEAVEATVVFLEQEAQINTSLEQLHSLREEIADQFTGQVFNLLEVRRLSYVEVLKEHPNKDAVLKEVMEVFKRVRFGQTYFYPGVVEVLETLSRQTKVALITNGNSHPRHSGIDHLFGHVVMGEEHPFRKPDPRIFHLAMDAMNITSPGAVVHVGDSLEEDVAGANGIGAQSVWFNPKGHLNHTDIAADHTISQMSELLELI